MCNISCLRDSLAPIHKEGLLFIAIGGIVSFIFAFIWAPLAWLCALVTLWMCYFFRDPERVTPMRDGLIISPADGRITSIETTSLPAELSEGAVTPFQADTSHVRISIFLSIFDVHVNRSPIAGRIIKHVYKPGKLLNAAADKASEDNERSSIIIETDKGAHIAVVQIAGFIARRIVTFVSEGTTLSAAERFGIIRFGSRVDVYLPKETVPLVAVGQRVIAGETILADLNAALQAAPYTFKAT